MTNPAFRLVAPKWAADLVQQPEPEHQWVVPGMFERGDRMIVTGNEGEGKSTLLRQWAIMMAAGINPATMEEIPPVRVLLMDLENSEEQTRLEIIKICDRAGIEVPGEPWLAVACWPAGLNLAREDYEAAVKIVIDEYRPDIVLGGPLYKMTEASLSDEGASRAVSATLDRLREAYGFVLVLEAHQVNESQGYDSQARKFVKNRPPRPFGSSIWRRWPEFGYCLFQDGTFFRWRGDRQSRSWPQKFQRDGDVWLWQPDNGRCPVCGASRPEGKVTYCSDKCAETAKKRRQRLRSKQIALT